MLNGRMIMKKETNGVVDRILMWGSFVLFVACEIGMVYGFLKFCGRL